MDHTLYLNDRKYRICDIGEGECALIITNAMQVESLCESYCNQYLDLERRIIIDTSLAWPKAINELSEEECDSLALDIHLLADIYWLEQIKIETDYCNINLARMLSEELYPRCANE